MKPIVILFLATAIGFFAVAQIDRRPATGGLSCILQMNSLSYDTHGMKTPVPGIDLVYNSHTGIYELPPQAPFRATVRAANVDQTVLSMRLEGGVQQQEVIEAVGPLAPPHFEMKITTYMPNPQSEGWVATTIHCSR